ncbi:FUSC family protein [Agrobacterium vitis]|uniref:FUSC family protein n=1 Tax=Agrobacterium vitis TaxID=373 RepID=A0A6L6VGV0_AGRVI|nr:FUSC family protein [Agrobacterium vitis]
MKTVLGLAMTSETDKSRRPSGHWVRRIARWLELRAIGLTPEHLDIIDGLRSAFIVGVPVLIVAAGQSQFGWSIFAAFWTCLADTGGEKRFQRRMLATFALLGSLTAFLASWLAGFGSIAGLAAGSILVGLTALLPVRWPVVPLVATLLGVVGVVAAGYPHTAPQAALLACSFLAGSAWATLVLTVLWPTDVWRPARRAISAVYARLADMTLELDTISQPAATQVWTFKSSQHRRAVRNAMERARSHLARAARPSEQSDKTSLHVALLAADDIFHALLALDHLRSSERQADIGKLCAEVIQPCLIAAARNLTLHTEPMAELQNRLSVLEQSVSDRHDPVAGAVRSIATALQWKAAPDVVGAAGPEQSALDKMAQARQRQHFLRGAIRSAVGVTVVTVVAHLLALNYPYWAAMAVVVVLQPDRRMSWSRALERIVGSVVGSALALALLTGIPASGLLTAIIIPLAAATIALRSVSYTLFVTVLTMLFVLTTDMLHPGAGIASARMLDNIIGSLAAIIVTFLVWPDKAPSMSELAAQALEANRAYRDAAERGDAAQIALTRRAAGIASTEAEIAFHAPDRYLGKTPPAADVETLAKARQLAGQAAVLWHSR